MAKKLVSGLIVSCQATESEPFFNYNCMRLMAKAAVEGGAVGIRALSDEISEIKKEVSVPIIGLNKKCVEGSDVYITGTFRDADCVALSGCDIIALDATLRCRPDGVTLDTLFAYIKKTYPDILTMADIATVKEAANAVRLGFDYISTTLRGYTEETKDIEIPDFKFIKEVKKLAGDKLVAEGGVWTVEQVMHLQKIGVDKIVIGTAITRPREITRRFAKALAV